MVVVVKGWRGGAAVAQGHDVVDGRKAKLYP